MRIGTSDLEIRFLINHSHKKTFEIQRFSIKNYSISNIKDIPVIV